MLTALLYVQLRLRVHQQWRLSAIKVHIRLDLWPDVRCIFLYFSEAIKELIFFTHGVQNLPKITLSVTVFEITTFSIS